MSRTIDESYTPVNDLKASRTQEGKCQTLYTGTNPSALKSREMIVQAMFTLLKTTPYTKINIKRLTDEAKVSRQTFYALFADRDEVIQCRLETIFADYQEALAKLPLTMHALVTLFFQFYEAHAGLFNCLLDNHLENLLTLNAKRCMQILNLANESTYVSDFIAAGLTQILSDWHQQQDTDLQTLVALTEALLNPAAVRAE